MIYNKMKKRKWILTLIVALGASIFAVALLFHIVHLKKPSGQFLTWENTIVGEICIPARYIWAALSPDKRWLFFTDDKSYPKLFEIVSPLKYREEYFTSVPCDFYIWTFFWVGKWLVLCGLVGDPYIIDYELDGNFAKHENAAQVLAWSKEEKKRILTPLLPLGFGLGWTRVMERISLYASFVPGPDGKTIAVLTSYEGEGENKIFKGFLYSLPEGKRLKEVKWKGVVFEGPFRDTSNYHRILVWDKDGKSAWSVGEEIMKPYAPGNYILISVNFEGGIRKLNGNHKREWLYSDTLYSQPAPDRIAVIITKTPQTIDSLEEIWLAHYSSTKKLWEGRIPWREISPKLARVVAITPDGKGIMFQDGMGEELHRVSKVRIWMYKIGDKKAELVTESPPINHAIGWLDKYHLLVISGNEKKRAVGIVKLKQK